MAQLKGGRMENVLVVLVVIVALDLVFDFIPASWDDKDSRP